MNRSVLLPKLALSGIRKNGIVYIPYIFTILFASSIYFCFSSIVANPMMEKVPHAGYAIILLTIGKYLLGIVLIPFLIYTNSFLFKRRKKEMGLYTVLGLEKKHVGIMLILESMILFILSIGGGFVISIVFSKLLFLILLKMSNLPADTSFILNKACFFDTVKLFGVIFCVNLISNLWQIGRMNPTELLQSGKKGEKEPKHLIIITIIGIIALFIGYGVSISAKLDSMIFLKFPVAIIFVIIGTYCVFTAGIIQYLKHLKKNPKIYYQKDNFVTISGMLYRMKKSAASLINICLFSTMIIITLTCTVALTLGEKDAIKFFNPFDTSFVFKGIQKEETNKFKDKLEKEAYADKVRLEDEFQYIYGSIDVNQQNTQFRLDETDGIQDGDCCVRIIPLSVYNEIEEKKENLNENECLIFNTSGYYKKDTISILNHSFNVKQELESFALDNKNVHCLPHNIYYLVVNDEKTLESICNQNQLYTCVVSNISGDEKDIREFLKQASLIFDDTGSGFRSQNIYEYGDDVKALDGGLLFIGVFFGLVFAISLLLVMYYKQISEGLEDQDSFHIMKKVGMSNEDIRYTIKKQILLVFTLPAMVAILHICAALPMLINLMYALNLYNTKSTIFSTLIVVTAYLIFYVISYFYTAKTYYKIIQ